MNYRLYKGFPVTIRVIVLNCTLKTVSSTSPIYDPLWLIQTGPNLDFNTKPDSSFDFRSTHNPRAICLFILVTLLPSQLYFIPTFSPILPPSAAWPSVQPASGHTASTSHLQGTRQAPSLTSRRVQSVGWRCLRSPYLCQCTTLLSTAVDPWPDTRQLPPLPPPLPHSQHQHMFSPEHTPTHTSTVPTHTCLSRPPLSRHTHTHIDLKHRNMHAYKDKCL